MTVRNGHYPCLMYRHRTVPSLLEDNWRWTRRELLPTMFLRWQRRCSSMKSMFSWTRDYRLPNTNRQVLRREIDRCSPLTPLLFVAPHRSERFVDRWNLSSRVWSRYFSRHGSDRVEAKRHENEIPRESNIWAKPNNDRNHRERPTSLWTTDSDSPLVDRYFPRREWSSCLCQWPCERRSPVHWVIHWLIDLRANRSVPTDKHSYSTISRRSVSLPTLLLNHRQWPIDNHWSLQLMNRQSNEHED